MKKLILIVTACVFSVGIISAQQGTAKKETGTATAKATCDMKNCYMMKDGKMVIIKGGNEMLMDKEVTMKDGNKVTPEGAYITKQGKKNKIRNGQCYDINGNMSMMTETEKPAAK